MKMSFTRSGGFAGPATTIQGEVTFDGNAGRSKSDFGYQRDLAPAEVQTLRAAMEKLPGGASKTPGKPDQYQYDVRLTWDSGRTQNLTLREGSSEPLLDWIQQECGRIWEQRARQ